MQSGTHQEFPIAVIFTQFEYNRIPFTHLNQIHESGILNIYIVLNDEEYKKAQNDKFVVFDFTPPRIVLEHYQSHCDNSHLKFHVINSGNITTEEEKLHFYLDNVKDSYLMNLFVCHEPLPWVSRSLRSKPFLKHITEYSFIFPLFKTEWWKLPSGEKSRSNEQAITLLNRGLNPCYCHQMGECDVWHYQWLFNIFVELVTLKISENDSDYSKNAKEEIKKLIQSYYQNITDLEKAEHAFSITHEKCYSTINIPSGRILQQHESNVDSRKRCEARFSEIIRDIINLHQSLMLQNKKYNKEILAVSQI